MKRTRLGRYTIDRRLGHGGMGVVYLARGRGLVNVAPEVALKVMHPHVAATPRSLELFIREARILAELNHRAIVKVLELGSADGRPFIAMEYLRGLDLAAWLQQRGPLPWVAAAHVGAEVAHALAAAHAVRTRAAPRGIIHGDLSPSNVMLCEDGAVKVLDFGLARAAGEEPSTASTRGKLCYLPPEAANGLALDGRADTYALGVLLYEAATGVRPFHGNNELETLNRVLHLAPPPPSTQRPLPAGADDIIMRALARDRSARFASAQDLASALERASDSFRTSDLARMLSRQEAPDARADKNLGTRGRPASRWGILALLLATLLLAAGAGSLLIRGIHRPAQPQAGVAPRQNGSSQQPGGGERAIRPRAPAREPPGPSPAALSGRKNRATRAPRARTRKRRDRPRVRADRGRADPQKDEAGVLAPGLLADPFEAR